MGYEFENFMSESRNNNSISAEAEKQLRKWCLIFLNSLIEQLRNRFPVNVNVLRKSACTVSRKMLQIPSNQD
jgi:hypothetical protein